MQPPMFRMEIATADGVVREADFLKALDAFMTRAMFEIAKGATAGSIIDGAGKTLGTFVITDDRELTES